MTSDNKFSHLKKALRSRRVFVDPTTGDDLPRQLRADQLHPHPENPKIHPEKQHAMVAGSLDGLGQIDSIKINIRNGMIVDGHERAWLALGYGDDTLVDVDYVDLSEDEHRLALAIFDETRSYAHYERKAIETLLQDDSLQTFLAQLQDEDARLQTLLDDLAESQGFTPPDFQPISSNDLPRLDQLEPQWVKCPHCGEPFDIRLVARD